MSVLEINKSDFENEVKKSDKPVLVDFWAPWCGPCKAVAPVFEKLSVEHAHRYKFCKVNVDDNPELSAEYGIMSIPTFIVFKNGLPFKKTVGAVNSQSILDMLEKRD